MQTRWIITGQDLIWGCSWHLFSAPQLRSAFQGDVWHLFSALRLRPAFDADARTSGALRKCHQASFSSGALRKW